MNWDQIEIKWAEMTSRVRADIPIPLRGEGPPSDQTAPAKPVLPGEPDLPGLLPPEPVRPVSAE